MFALLIRLILLIRSLSSLRPFRIVYFCNSVHISKTYPEYIGIICYIHSLETVIMENGKHIHSGICCKSGASNGIKHLVTNFQIKGLANIVTNCTIDVLC